MFTRIRQFSLPWDRFVQSALSLPISLKFILISYFHLLLGLQIKSLYFRFNHLNFAVPVLSYNIIQEDNTQYHNFFKTAGGRLLLVVLRHPTTTFPLQSVLTQAVNRQATRNSHREWQYNMLHVYNCILLKMSTWDSKHAEENSILWINNNQCIKLVINI